ncbi:MAG: DUF922 domain-containing protein [Bacteroidetes bacterium]|nr:DUF922 domain-containing protein [Bacteroidota bacterium]MBS1740210.1 DUF922 domain-containing protein [Bacteroidota bacterium]
MRSIILSFLLMVIVFTARSQTINSVEVVWDSLLCRAGEISYPPKHFNWQYFQAIPNHNSEYAAMTFSGIKVKYAMRKKSKDIQAQISIVAFMDTSKSWYKNDRCGDSTLAHERGHFDLTALAACQLIDTLKQIKFTVENFASLVRNIHEEYQSKLAKRQEQYDAETNHGTLADEQKKWFLKIKKELETCRNHP